VVYLLHLPVLLERTHEAGLVLGGLEATMTKLGTGVDEFERNFLYKPLLSQSLQGLSKSQDTLLVSNAGSLDHEEVLLHLSVVREATHGSDGLIGQIVVRGGVILDQLAVLHLIALPDPVDLLVDLSTVVVTFLTSPGYSVLDPAGMPSTNAGDFPQTLVSLPWQLLGVPPGSYTFKSMSLGDANDVDALVHGEHISDWHLFLEMLPGEVDLVGNAATVQLNLHNVSLLLPAAQDLHLSVHNDSDNSAVLLDLVQIFLDLLLAKIIGPLGARFSESLLLGCRPK